MHFDITIMHNLQFKLITSLEYKNIHDKVFIVRLVKSWMLWWWTHSSDVGDMKS